jgi:hypothetical protein
MRRELLQDQAPAPSEEASLRWFEAHDPKATPLPLPQPTAWMAAPPIVLALLGLALIPSALPRVLVPLALATIAVLLVVRSRRAARPHRDLGPPRGIELISDRLCFRGQGRTHFLLSTAAPFGVTVLATPRRDRVVALLSSSLGTFYVGAPFDAASRRAFAPLLDRVTTVGTDDAGLESIGPDGEPLLVAPEDLAALVDALVDASPSCLDRFVLTDARGKSLALDGPVFAAGERTFDLTAPLEWRSIVFQETFGQVVAVYQGTWIRQNGSELVLVCLLPSLGPAAGPDLDLASLDRSALRDLRLMQAAPEQPPPTEQRVAIERLFMLPLRSALDRAPRVPGLLKKSAFP